MHVNPAKGEGIDVPGAILDTWFGPGRPARIPIFAFNALGPESIKEIVDLVLSRFPHWNVGAVCPGGRVHQPLRAADAPATTTPTSRTCCATRPSTCSWSPTTATRSSSTAWSIRATTWWSSTSPTPTEELLARDLRPGGTLIKLTGSDVLVRRQGLVEEFTLDPEDRFGRVFLREVALIIGEMERAAMLPIRGEA